MAGKAIDPAFAAAYGAIGCGVIVQGADGRVVYTNETARRMRADHELIDALAGAERVLSTGAPLADDQLPHAVARRTGAAVRAMVVGIRAGDGAIRWRQVDAVPTEDGRIVTTVVDVSEQREAERALREQALRDALTQLPNRALFLDRLEHGIARAKRDKTVLSLLVMDLDAFKEVNDTFGHHAGDALLCQVAERLARTVRKSDSIARLGGDEFAFVLPNTNDAGAAVVERSLLAALEAPFGVEGQSLSVGASVGLALFPRHGEDASGLMRRAEIAMYTAKRAGGGSATYTFEDELDERAPQQRAVVPELRRALERDELALLYQPIVELDTRTSERVEALVRWRHPTRGLLLPADFVAAAERSGLVRQLFETTLRIALRECAAWRAGGTELRVNVNISMRNLVDPEIAEVVGAALAEAHLAGEWLGLEITEAMLMADPERSLRTLARLRAMGVHLAVDDFGTGYSSLAYLQRLPVQSVKIDRTFVRDMTHDAASLAIVLATTDVAHRLGLRVVAEGVEDAETLERLAAAGVDAAQGHHLARPMPAAQLADWRP